jgi:phytol kinase
LPPLLLIAAWMALVLISAVVSSRRWPERKELSRKIVHIGTGPVTLLAWWLKIPASVAVPIALGTTLIALINHRWRLLPAVEDVQRLSYGTVAYGLAISLLLLAFWPEHASVVCSGVLVMACADGLAGLAGRAIPSAHWNVWGQRKSLVGTLTMAVVSLLVLLAMTAITQQPTPLFSLVAISLLATALEQVSCWGIDNLSVPLAVAFCWRWQSLQTLTS